VPELGVEVGQGLVQQQNPRTPDQGTAERDSLLLAARERARFAVELGVEAEHRRRLPDAAIDLLPT
jgi:hypothetical protein